MSNDFSKEEKVAFDEAMIGFSDMEVMAKAVTIKNTDQVAMARTNDVLWFPQPYIAQSYDGMDSTANFGGSTQLSVPATIGYQKHSPLELDAKELRDALQEKTLGDAAKKKLASDINKACLNAACNEGTLVVKRTTAAAGYDDVALCDSIMNEQGVPDWDRFLALTSRDYNGMASNLAASTRSFTSNPKSQEAYERSRVGMVAGFETLKLDYGNRLTAAAGGGSLTLSTLVGAGNYYVPSAVSVGVAGQSSNVDNRYQTITISSTTNVAAGDAFTIANCYAVHHVAKTNTGQLKTFRVISVDSSTTMTISPPIISAQGGSDAELQYQNCEMSATASNAAIVFLNTATAGVNPFWQKDAIALLPGRLAIPSDSGVAVRRATTDSGIEVVMTKWTRGETLKTRYRFDVLFGTAMLNPEMAGIMLFSQS